MAFNSLFGKIGRNASEEVLFALIKSKCLPILLYDVEACPTNSADKQPLQFTMNRVLFKIFGAMAKDSYLEISSHFGIHPLEQSIALRGDKFLKKYTVRRTDNYLCRLIAKQSNISSCFSSSFSFSFCCCVVFINVLFAHIDATIKLVK